MSRSSASAAIATLGIDLGKNSFHLVGQGWVTSVNECKFGCGLRWPLVSSPVG